MDATHANGGKFIWSIGGWSDLTKTLAADQVDAFVGKCVELLKISGDGVDLDWEHLSTNMDIRDQQLKTVGQVFLKLRQGFDANGLKDKQIGWTTRWNAFYDNSTRPDGYKVYDSDGEGIEIEKELQANGSSLKKVVDWVNIMFYDMAPADVGAPVGLTLDNYKLVFEFFKKYVNEDQMVMGFEPGGQSASGSWEGIDVDESVVKHIASQPYGGTQFWAINEGAYNGSKVITGKNVNTLAVLSK